MKNPVKMKIIIAIKGNLSSKNKNAKVKGKIVKNERTTTPFAPNFFSILEEKILNEILNVKEIV